MKILKKNQENHQNYIYILYIPRTFAELLFLSAGLGQRLIKDLLRSYKLTGIKLLWKLIGNFWKCSK